jgi:hypothetical protein
MLVSDPYTARAAHYAPALDEARSSEAFGFEQFGDTTIASPSGARFENAVYDIWLTVVDASFYMRRLPLLRSSTLRSIVTRADLHAISDTVLRCVDCASEFIMTAYNDCPCLYRVCCLAGDSATAFS